MSKKQKPPVKHEWLFSENIPCNHVERAWAPGNLFPKSFPCCTLGTSRRVFPITGYVDDSDETWTWRLTPEGEPMRFPHSFDWREILGTELAL